MNRIDIEQEFGNKIHKVWDNHPSFQSVPFIECGFTHPKQAYENSLLFLGINPSYNGQDTVNFYDLPENPELPYFKKFQEISQVCGIPWSHLDALWIRHTKQSELKEKLIKNTKLCEFAHQQFHVTKEILYRIKPRIILICDAFAREWFLHEDDANGFSSEGFRVKFDDTIGTYRIVNDSQLNGTPVFCSSMLSGQRALDKGSLERLIWHMNLVLSKL